MPTKAKPVARSKNPRTVSATEFKAKSLAYLTLVNRDQTDLIVTKHHKPFVRVIPVVPQATESIVGRTPGFFQPAPGYDLVAPLAPDWEWGDDI